MDKQRLMALLQKPESTKLDYKLQLSLKTDYEKKEMAKDVCAIANSKGGRGYIIFGIEDKTKAIIGIQPKGYTEEQLQQVISQRCDPPVSVKFDLIDIDCKTIGVLTIYKSTQRPHQMRQTGVFYIRRGSTTDIARREEIAGMLQECGMIHPETTIINSVNVNQLDREMIERYINKAGLANSSGDHNIVLQSIGVIGKDEDTSRLHPTLGGLLVFGVYPQQILPHTGVKVINSLKKGQSKYFFGNIIKILDDIEEYLKELINPSAYPIDALIDALSNACVHRDYFAFTRQIVLFISESRVEISNPGDIFCDDNIDEILSDLNPCRRNSWLYERLMVIDDKKRFLKTGMGLKRIQTAFDGLGKVQFVNNHRRNLFKVVFPGLRN